MARREAPRYDAARRRGRAAPPEVLVAPPVAPGRPAAADAAEQRLVAAGLSAGLAADVVGEAVTHGLPFAQPRAFKKLVRTALARRLPVLADLGPDRRVIAVAGAGGVRQVRARRQARRRLRRPPTTRSSSSPSAPATAAAPSPPSSSRSA